jgi:hypothetical protein
MATNWQEIATELHDALRSFMAHEKTNEGNWNLAEVAMIHYDYALMTMEIPSDESKRRRFDAGVDEVHQQMLAEKRQEKADGLEQAER